MRKLEEDCLMEDPNHISSQRHKERMRYYFRWNTEYTAEKGEEMGRMMKIREQRGRPLYLTVIS
jgi:hypothetical protein